MNSPPKKKSKTTESNSMRIVMDRWRIVQLEQIFPIYRINGYPWHLRLFKDCISGNLHLEVICDKSSEAELWQCTATIKLRCDHPSVVKSVTHTFESWGETSKKFRIDNYPERYYHSSFKVKIVTNDNGDMYLHRPILDPFEQRDGILVIGEEKKKVNVNKKSLASQSPFFDRLFNGNFKEKNMAEIPIEDVEHEEFCNIIKMIYGFSGVSLTDENVRRVLQLSDRFDIKIVKDRVVSYLLSSSSYIDIHQKLLISEQYNLPFLKEKIIEQYSISLLRELSESFVWDELSKDTIKAIVIECDEVDEDSDSE